MTGEHTVPFSNAEIDSLLTHAYNLENGDASVSHTLDFSIDEIERLLNIVANSEYYAPVGIHWDMTSSSPTLERIDINKDPLPYSSTSWFDKHALFGSIKARGLNRSNQHFIDGTDNKGTGLDLTGASGYDIMTEINVPRFAYELDGTDFYFWLKPYSPYDTKFDMWPAAFMRGGITRQKIYLSTYEASGRWDGTKFYLQSITGAQPVTGAVSYTNLPNSGRFTIADAETYANNIGAGYGCENFWTHALVSWLMVIEAGTWDLQGSSLFGASKGRGVATLDNGTGFAGKNTGADSIDSNLLSNGTGAGTGLNGETPIRYRNIENPYGNIWKYAIGINAATTTGICNVIKRAGLSSATIEAELSSGNYETLVGALPSATGYISALQTELIGAIGLLPSSVNNGSNVTYLCDLYNAPNNAVSVASYGGRWSTSTSNGPMALDFISSAASSQRFVGCRFEYIPQA